MAAYRQEYGFNSITLLPANLYGPHDDFDPETSHVIPEPIRRCIAAKNSLSEEVCVWGDGTATREFPYVDDTAKGLLLAAERYDDSAPVNLGSGTETSISELTGLIAQAVGFEGRITWDTTRPNGQPRRRVDTTRAKPTAAQYGNDSCQGRYDSDRGTPPTARNASMWRNDINGHDSLAPLAWLARSVRKHGGGCRSCAGTTPYELRFLADFDITAFDHETVECELALETTIDASRDLLVLNEGVRII